MKPVHQLCRSIAGNEQARLAVSAALLAAMLVLLACCLTQWSPIRAALLASASAVLAVSVALLHRLPLGAACLRALGSLACAAAAAVPLVAGHGVAAGNAALVLASTLGWDMWLVSVEQGNRATSTRTGTALPALAFAGALAASTLPAAAELLLVIPAMVLGCALVTILRRLRRGASPPKARAVCPRGAVLWANSQVALGAASVGFALATAASCTIAVPALARLPRADALVSLYPVLFAGGLAFFALGDAPLGAITALAVVGGAAACFGAGASLDTPVAAQGYATSVVVGMALASMIFTLRRPPRPSPHVDPGLVGAAAGVAGPGLTWAPFVVFEGSLGATAIAVVAGLTALILAYLSIVAVGSAFARKRGALRADPSVVAGSREHRARVMSRFAHLPPEVRGWAYGKLRLDPMFPGLADVLPSRGRVLDAGCGYGLAAAWLAALRPGLSFHAFDPDRFRVGVASHVLGDRGSVRVGSLEAPFARDETFDAALCLDVLHLVRRPERALEALAEALSANATLVVRTTVTDGGESLRHAVERWLVRMRGQRVQGFRSSARMCAMLDDAGFDLVRSLRAAGGRPETMFVARRRGSPAALTNGGRQRNVP